jgi:thymidylate synthase
MNLEEKNYLNLLENILNTGSVKKDRTGVGTISIFGSQLKFSLENNKIPMLTSKKMFHRGVIEELLFFIRGDTNTKLLEEKGVNIWKGNTSREFLDSKGFSNLEEGSMGKGYGFQWRRFGETETSKGIDQLKNVVNIIKTDPDSRRIIISAWNPLQLNEMVLPPCHAFMQFYVNDNKLSCHFYMRSVDTFLGLPFNILSYAILTHMLASMLNLQAKELIFSGGDTHIYSNHIEQVKTQIQREPFAFPYLLIKKKISSIEEMEKMKFKDFEINGYQSHPPIKGEMAI